jgi:hypothetical protein
MATSIYEEHDIYLIDGTKITISPSKIKYLRRILDTFNFIKDAKDDDEAIAVMVECARIAMEQFYSEISLSVESIEDNLDLKTVYKILEVCAAIKINSSSEESVEKQAKSESDGSTWEDLDLIKLESEVFMIGAWKNYEDLEKSISMPELLKIIESKRDLDHLERKFLAAIQGVDIDEGKKEDAWEDMKSRILYKGKDKNDITRLTGAAAQKAGFGIGNGLGYEEITA